MPIASIAWQPTRRDGCLTRDGSQLWLSSEKVTFGDPRIAIPYGDHEPGAIQRTNRRARKGATRYRRERPLSALAAYPHPERDSEQDPTRARPRALTSTSTLRAAQQGQISETTWLSFRSCDHHSRPSRIDVRSFLGYFLRSDGNRLVGVWPMSNKDG